MIYFRLKPINCSIRRSGFCIVKANNEMEAKEQAEKDMKLKYTNTEIFEFVRLEIMSV